MDTSRTIIVTNRLPIKIQIKKQEWRFQNSEGGLATGLGSIFPGNNNTWIGWPGAVINNPEVQAEITHTLTEKKLKPVWLTQPEVNNFYEGFSNETLWPLFHYFSTYAVYHPAYWEAYQKVNRKFADIVLENAAPQDTIWIHDYQLMLLPSLIREKMPDVSIGFFQHIPFPSYELFRLLPWREELLKGLIGADLIGFHTFDDTRHFLSAVSRILYLPCHANEITLEEKRIMVDAFPMGIDYEKYRQLTFQEKTKRNEKKLTQMIGEKKLMISIDRLDYSKGIVERLQAYELFLKTYPQFHEKIVFLQLIVPSRDTVTQYATLKEEINRLVADINARYGTLSWQPIYYFYRSFPMEMISALYTTADIALVSPLRDGMNLVSKEYIASKTDRQGVLILSEMAGASKELYDALIINPHNNREVVEAIYKALTMPRAEQRRRMESMQQTVQKFNIHHWVTNFTGRLKAIKSRQQALNTKMLGPDISRIIQEQYQAAKERLIFLDYDGTLVPFRGNPLEAAPDKNLLSILRHLSSDRKNIIVLISGRKMDTLEKWFGALPVDIIAEHGAWFKNREQGWQCIQHLGNEWKEAIRPIFRQYEMITPGSFIEEKSFSLAWHYRQADPGLGELRAQEIIGNLKNAISGMELQLLQGNKVIEVKSIYINKGKAAAKWLARHPQAGFMLAIGDDTTDEDMFQTMPAKAFTVKVGMELSHAVYYVKNVTEARRLLEMLISPKAVLPAGKQATDIIKS